VAIVILRRRNKQNKPIKPVRVVVPAMIAAFVICLIYGICILMSQSYSLRFNTPEEAYKFTNEVDCTHVIYGENSALAIAVSEDNTELLVLKDGDKWEILSPFLYMPKWLAFHENMLINSWDNKYSADLYVQVIIMSDDPSSTKQIMLNDQAARAEIIEENMNKNGYIYHLYYCLDGSTDEITMLIDGETYITIQVNDS
jgi:hypothetical protein